jgi:hypothetical protein
MLSARQALALAKHLYEQLGDEHGVAKTNFLEAELLVDSIMSDPHSVNKELLKEIPDSIEKAIEHFKDKKYSGLQAKALLTKGKMWSCIFTLGVGSIGKSVDALKRAKFCLEQAKNCKTTQLRLILDSINMVDQMIEE